MNKSPWYSIEQTVYHDNTHCTEVNNIEREKFAAPLQAPRITSGEFAAYSGSQATIPQATIVASEPVFS